MLRRIPQSEYLEPEDLKLCSRVFDYMCTEVGVESNSSESEALAMAVLAVFQSGIVDEADLQERIRQHIAYLRPSVTFQAAEMRRGKPLPAVSRTAEKAGGSE